MSHRVESVARALPIEPIERFTHRSDGRRSTGRPVTVSDSSPAPRVPKAGPRAPGRRSRRERQRGRRRTRISRRSRTTPRCPTVPRRRPRCRRCRPACRRCPRSGRRHRSSRDPTLRPRHPEPLCHLAGDGFGDGTVFVQRLAIHPEMAAFGTVGVGRQSGVEIVALAPGTAVIAAPISPPVQDSATASVSSRSRSASATSIGRSRSMSSFILESRSRADVKARVASRGTDLPGSMRKRKEKRALLAEYPP